MCVTLVDVGQGLGAVGAESRRVRLDRSRTGRGKCTADTPTVTNIRFTLYDLVETSDRERHYVLRMCY